MIHLMFQSLFLLALAIIFSDVIESMTVEGDNGNTTRLSLLNSMLNKSKYDSRVPPEYEKNVPTNVTIKIHLLSFDSVSETKMDYSVELFLTQEWIDERLHFANLTDSKWLEVDSKMMQDVWVPDVYFRNEKSASFHDVTVPNKFMHLYPGGRVVYSVRLSLTLNCRMNLVKYPLDSQTCPMWIQSYTYTTENVMFFWDQGKPVIFDTEMEVHTELPQFSITENKTESCQTHADSSDEPAFACIVAKFTLQRDIRYYIIQVYVPSILIVALSWVSFWLDLEAIPARVSLGVLTVLTLNTHGSTIQAALPKGDSYMLEVTRQVSYIKAIDVWVVSSLIFVFAALLEFAYVNVLARRADKEIAVMEVLARSQLQGDRYKRNGTSGLNEVVRKREKGSYAERQALNDRGLSDDVNSEMNRHIHIGDGVSSRAKARRVDKISRVLFPVCFSVFNVIYWVSYVYLDI